MTKTMFLFVFGISILAIMQTFLRFSCKFVLNNGFLGIQFNRELIVVLWTALGAVFTVGYDDDNGLPKDKDYLECGLPDFLVDSVAAMKTAWEKIDRDEEYLRWDCDYCNLQTDINIAEVNGIISTEHAWHLREKYLRIERV